MSDNLRDDLDDVLWTHAVEPRGEVLDALLPVIREHLAQAWDDGCRAGWGSVPPDDKHANPWRKDT